MTNDFLKWLANRWSVTSDHGDRHWQRIQTAITQQLTPDQTLIWTRALVDLMMERWGSLKPPGLATALTAIVFLQIEHAERSKRWPAPAMGVAKVEPYLRTAFDEILVHEEQIAQTRAVQAHPHDAQQQAHFVTACRDELSGVLVALVIQAHARAITGAP